MQKKQAPQEIKGKKSSWPQTFPEQHSMWQINGANFYLVLRKRKVWPKSVTTYFHELIWKTGPATHGLKHEGSQENPIPISLLWTFPSLSCAKTNTCHLTTQLLSCSSQEWKLCCPHMPHMWAFGGICILISVLLLFFLLSHVPGSLKALSSDLTTVKKISIYSKSKTNTSHGTGN